jgi:hypothetical protein
MSEAIAVSLEILTAAELAQLWKVKLSWVIDACKPSRNHDPLPNVKLGRHNRFAPNSPAMLAWLKRRGLK